MFYHEYYKPYRFSSLHFASFFGIVEIVAALAGVEGCGINQNDCAGNTPHLLAAEHGHKAVVGILLGRDGIEPEQPHGLSQTQLCCAAGKGHEEVVTIVLERDEANPDEPDCFGATLLVKGRRECEDTTRTGRRQPQQAGQI